jgi:vitamin B12 transporter
MTTLVVLMLGLASLSQVDSDELPHYWLPEIVVTAKRIREPLQDVAVDMKVITEEEISQRGIRTLSQLFVEEGILDTRVNGIEGGLLTIGLRGFPADHMLVMVDGTTVNSPANGTFDFSEIPISSISRIELVKGPASSYYGAYASSGVINIITKQPAEERMNVELEANVSADGTYHAYTSGGINRDALSSQLFVSRRESNGERTNSNFESISGGGYLSYAGFATLKFSAGKRDVGVPGPVPPPDFIPAFGDSKVYSLFDVQENNHRAGSVQFEKSLGGFDILSALSYRKERLIYEQVYQGFREDWSTYRARDNWYYDTEIMTGSAQVTYQWFSVGFETQDQEFWAYDTLMDSDTDSLVSSMSWNPHRKNRAIWAGVKVPLFSKMLIPSASLRSDKNSDYDNFMSASASALLKPLPFISIGTSIAEGVRPPTFNELYWPGYGNPDLKPQKSLQMSSFVDVSYKNKLFVRVSGFSRQVKDAISWIGFTPQNVDRFISKGIEIEPQLHPVNVLSISLAAVFMKAVEKRIADPAYHWTIEGRTVAERRASYVPETKFTASLNVTPTPATSVTLSSVYTGNRIAYFYDYADAEYKIKRIDPVTLFHACVLQKVFGSLHLSLRVDNILDEQYPANFGYTLSDLDYPAPGRSISLGLRYVL